MVVLCFSPFQELVCSGLALNTELSYRLPAFFGHFVLRTAHGFCTYKRFGAKIGDKKIGDNALVS